MLFVIAKEEKNTQGDEDNCVAVSVRLHFDRFNREAILDKMLLIKNLKDFQ